MLGVVLVREQTDSKEATMESTEIVKYTGMQSSISLRLLDSPIFSEWIALTYLFKQEHPGVLDFVCNRMYSLPHDKMEAYLFQLCYILMHKHCSSLEKYISDMCATSLKIAVKVFWLLQAGAEDVDDSEEILRIQERCRNAALKGQWQVPVRPETNRLQNLVSSSRALSVSAVPSVQTTPVSSPCGDEKLVKRVKLSSRNSSASLRRMFRRSRGWDSYPKKPIQNEVSAKIICDKEKDKESLCRKLFPETNDTESASTVSRLDKESHDRRFGDSKSLLENPKALPKELCFTKIGGNRTAAREEIENMRWLLFHKRLRIHPAEELEAQSENPASPDADANSLAAESPLKILSKENHMAFSFGSPLSQSNLLKLFIRKTSSKTVYKNTEESNCVEKSPTDSLTEDQKSAARNDDLCSVKAGLEEHSTVEVVNPSGGTIQTPTARFDTENSNLFSWSGSGAGKKNTPVKLFSSSLTSWNLAKINTSSSKRWGSSRKRTRKKSTEPVSQLSESFDQRSGAFAGTLDLIQSLCDISTGLVDIFSLEDRRQALNESLSRLNSYLTLAESRGGVCFPMGKGCYRILSIPAEEAVLMNSRERAPFLICFEVLGHEDDRVLEDQNKVDFENVSCTGTLPSGSKMRWPLVLPWRRKAHVVPSMQPDSLKLIQESYDCTILDDDVCDSEKDTSFEDGRVDGTDTTENSTPDQNFTITHGSRHLSPDQISATLKAFSRLHVTNEEAATPGKSEEQLQASKASEIKIKGPEPTNLSSVALAGECWESKKARIRKASDHGALATWDLRSAIVKSGDNCKQEHLALQLVSEFYDIFSHAGSPLWLRPYEILVTSSVTALIETIPDTASIHTIKKRFSQISSLREFFGLKYGKDSPSFQLAQKNFVESMAGYSILSYILQVKDRHNGNLLLDEDGHIIHVDFGFMLSNSPGGVNFESAPFKLNRELLEVMDSDADGSPSEAFDYFKVLCIQGYLICRRHAERIIFLVEMMQDSGCPCFRGGRRTISKLRRRFRLSLTEEKCMSFVLSLIKRSLDSWRTRQYDNYQRALNGIL